jgi:NADPH-dependent 2,4-dienoyl-CoA reductase/sulfur reductase-like enzyme
MTLTRRAALGASLAALAAPSLGRAQGAARLLVIGGGFGGATAARFARLTYPELQVTLVEPLARFITCPYGNLLLGGYRQIGDITHSYDGLRAAGIRVVQDWAEGIDAAGKRVRLRGGETLGYDKLILSPGIAIRWGGLPGYDEAASQVFPHAWIPGDGSQTQLLRRQLEAMPDGGVVGLSIPANPFRCPPGPYERISMIAAYLKRHKPRSKILALDAKDAFSKQGLFQDGWKALYGEMVEWVPANKDGKVARVDPAERVFETEFGVRHKVAVGNVIPPQSAARLVLDSGLAATTGWAEIDPATFAVRSAPDIHIVGDAINGAPMPKSGYIANSTAKQAVASAVAALRGTPAPDAVYFNTCYSHVGEEYGISIVGIFRPGAPGGNPGFVEVPNSGGVSPRGDLPEQRRLEAIYADTWYASITKDMFG